MFTVCDDRLTTRGRANTLPTTLPRNFTFSGKLSRQESYQAAIGGSSSSINSGGLTLASDRERLRCEEGPGTTRTVANGRKEGGRESGNRRGVMRKQSAVYLSAVHEEDGDGVGDPVTATTTHVRGGVTHITTTSLAQSTV